MSEQRIGHADMMNARLLPNQARSLFMRTGNLLLESLRPNDDVNPYLSEYLGTMLDNVDMLQRNGETFAAAEPAVKPPVIAVGQVAYISSTAMNFRHNTPERLSIEPYVDPSQLYEAHLSSSAVEIVRDATAVAYAEQYPVAS